MCVSVSLPVGWRSVGPTFARPELINEPVNEMLLSLPVRPDSDQYSDMSDSDNDKKRGGLRRGQRQQVNYRETSDSSDNSRASAKRSKVKARGRPRKEHQSSDYSDGQSLYSPMI